mgnify:CR=1 FL=1
MSRIGNVPIEIPAKVQVSVDGRTLTAKGPKGELKVDIPEEIDFNIEDNNITFSRSSELRRVKSLHGLSRSLAWNAIEGVTEGFKKVLKIEGVGYKAELKGPRLFLSLGFSHPILIIPPDGIEFQVPNANTIEVSGIDKQLLGEVAATIRKIRPPEPYKGKGIRYEGEYIRRKAGKTAA